MENKEKNIENNIEENIEEAIEKNTQEASMFDAQEEEPQSLDETIENLEDFEESNKVDENSSEENKEEPIIQTEEIQEKVKKEEVAEEIQDDFSYLDSLEENNNEFEPEENQIQPKAETKPQEQSYVQTLDSFDDEEEVVEELITVRPVKFQQFEQTPPIRTIKKNLDIMQDVSMHISVELGRTKSSIREVMDMEQGTIVELDKIAGEQVEIFVNEKLVAKGEVIVIEDKFGVRVTSTNLQKQIQ